MIALNSIVAVVAAFGILSVSSVRSADVGTAFMYWGELIGNGVAVDGDCEFEFTLAELPGRKFTRLTHPVRHVMFRWN